MTNPTLAQRLAQVRAYHQRTKHRLDRYAAGPGYLDWASQPDPFRRFAGAPLLSLPLPPEDTGPPFSALYRHGIGPRTLDRTGLAALLRLSLGLAAWKQYGESRWALRCNPSSGNLHPTEGYCLTSGVTGLEDGVYHYAPYEHGLELRCRFRDTREHPAAPGVLLALSSIAWREAWKYGERAFRYVQLDTGHALAAARYAAAALGWTLSLLPCSDWDLARLLGLDRKADFEVSEPETPDLLAAVGWSGKKPGRNDLSTWLEAGREGQWLGRAKPLGPPPKHRWPVIGEVEAATRAELPDTETAVPEDFDPPLPQRCSIPAARIIVGRRSAQQYDGVTRIGAAQFFRMLDVLLPRPDTPPWDLWAYPARIHPVLLVHRVDGLPPGLYALPRRQGARDELKGSMRGELDWSRPPGCPPGLPLFHLLSADGRSTAKTLSCHQDIAADGVFTLGMLAELDTALDKAPWRYRRLYWEAGMLGQVLYLEAEAAGVRGTGIGCFFDDGFHEVLGIEDTRFQSLYHFTVGGALEDTRLQTLPAYDHLPSPEPET